MKSEPDVFSIDDLKKRGRENWDGVRNYQARNFMRDEMKKGDLILFYHSSCKVPGVAGIAQVSKECLVDKTSLDPKSPYFDEKSTPEKPRWFMVEVKFVEKFKSFLSLQEMKEIKSLGEMLILKKGNRLSITPVSKKEFEVIKKKGHQ